MKMDQKQQQQTQQKLKPKQQQKMDENELQKMTFINKKRSPHHQFAQIKNTVIPY